jgi:hypothetical protein
MDWTVLMAVALVGAFVGYLLGLLVRSAFVERGDGGGGEQFPSLPPDGPAGQAIDFDLWEMEMAGGPLPVEG